ncbi:MAG: signal peptidase I [Eubacteriales bacterium]|nr:signal peptidase I [Eubacteriales bacterium]
MSEENKTKKLLEMREEPKKVFWTAERKKNLREWVLSFAVAIVAFLFIRTFLFTMIRVDGQSMCETLQHGDRLFVTVLDVRMNGVENEDVIICHYPGEGHTYFVKRVIAQEGQTVEIKGGVTYVDGVAMEEEYVDHRTMRDFGPYTVEEGEIFVMGDNRANSRDSRQVGALDEDLVVGKVRCIWWPLDRLGMVE